MVCEKYLDLAGNIRSKEKQFELVRFICLSAIALAPIAALVFTDVEISPNSPIGLVLKPEVASGSQNATQSVSSCMLNVGGDPKSNYQSGIQVPVDIFIFGIAGGYLRYLWQTAEKVKDRQVVSLKAKEKSTTVATAKNNPQREASLQIKQKSEDRSTDELKEAPEIFYEALRDIALFFLAPLLAIAVWLVLLQGGTTSPFTLAAISFTIGLVTREVIESLISFAGRILGGLKD